MDKTKMIAEIAARHNIRLDHDDPAFLLVELTLMVLEESTENLTNWKEDITALVGALEQGSKKWEETASAIGKAIFENQKREFIKDSEHEKEEFLRSVRSELKISLGDTLAPILRHLNAAVGHTSGKRSIVWAIAGALIGSVIGCAATLYIAKNSLFIDITNQASTSRTTNNRR